jgi:serine/threonine protein kinase
MGSVYTDLEAMYREWPSERLLDLLARTGADNDRAAIPLVVRVLRDRGVWHTLPVSRENPDSRLASATGVRGWLLVFLLHMIVSLLALGAFSSIVLSAGSWTTAGSLVAFLAYGVFTLFVLVTKRPRAAGHAQTWTMMWAIAFVVLLRAFAEAGAIGLFALCLVCSPAGWIPYLLKSKRVARTYASTGTSKQLSDIRGWLLVFVGCVFGYSLLLLLYAVRLLAAGRISTSILCGALSVFGMYTTALLVRKRPRARLHAIAWTALVGIVSVLTFVLDLRISGTPALIWSRLLEAIFALGWWRYLMTSERVAANFGIFRAGATSKPVSPSLEPTMESRTDPRSNLLGLATLDATVSADSDMTAPERLERRMSLDSAQMFASYRILRRLGAGGMGTVYLAEQQRPKRHVALKIMNPTPGSSEMLRRFRIEAEVLGRLKHPGIAHIYEAGTGPIATGEQPFFAMEYIAGESLIQYANTHRLSVRDRLDLVASICDAVDHAHRRGIIHRDLKPANILVDENGQPKVLDFGVAHLSVSDEFVTHLTTAGRIVGTLAYMSPEQVRGDPAIDPRSDVYALGVILYVLLSGELPYTGDLDQWHLLAQAILEREPARLGVLSRTCKGDVEVIVAKALEKDCEQRYDSAAELAADLRRHLNDHPINAQKPSASYRIRKFTKRNRVVVGSVAAVIVMFAAFLYDGPVRETQIVVRSTGSLELRRISPPPGSTVSRNTVVVADLEFTVDDFEKDRFRIQPHLLTGPATSQIISGDLVEGPILPEARGNLTVRVPLNVLFDNNTVNGPFQIQFALMQTCGTMGFCAQIARTEALRYAAPTKPR